MSRSRASTLNCITLKSGRDVFDRMVGGREFDVAELSASEYISLLRAPAIVRSSPSRCFPRGCSGTATSSSTRAPASARPKDLEGTPGRAAALYPDRRDLGARPSAASVRRRSFHHSLGAGRGREGRHPWQAACAAAAGAGPDRAEPRRRAARRAAGARRDRCADRIAQAGILRPPSRRRPPVSRLPRARARALRDDRNFSDHASHRHPPRSLRAPPLARDQLLQGIRRIQAAGARAHALCRLARLPCCRGYWPRSRRSTRCSAAMPGRTGSKPNRATLQALVQYMVEQHFIARAIPIEELFVPLPGELAS